MLIGSYVTQCLRGDGLSFWMITPRSPYADGCTCYYGDKRRGESTAFRCYRPRRSDTQPWHTHKRHSRIPGGSTSAENDQNRIRSLHELQSTEVRSNISAQFQSVLQAQLRARQQAATRFQAPLATKYMLRNSEDAFSNACNDSKIRSSLSQKCVDQERPAAMLVGMYTYSDATYQHGAGDATAFGITARDPTGVTDVGMGADATKAAAIQNS